MRTILAILVTLVCVFCWLALPVGIVAIKSDPLFTAIAFWNVAWTTILATEAWAWRNRRLY